MKIELLCPELNDLYGDFFNAQYLAASIPGGEIVRSSDAPVFSREKVDVVCVGSMSERNQGFALRRLLPYRDRIGEMIEGGTVFLATGNALELFGREIRDGENVIPGLGIFDYYSVRQMDDRRNCFFLGQFDGHDVVGHKGQFSFSYGTEAHPFIQVEGGFGSSLESKNEGFHYRNFYGTYLLGPFLPLNPYFGRHLLSVLGVDGPLAFEQDSIAAYEYRLKELRRPGREFLMDAI